MSEETKRRIAIPGDIIATGEEYLPGDNTERIGKDIIAKRYGLIDEIGKLIKIIPLSGVFIPRRGNVVIGKINDITLNGWIVDIGSANPAFLTISEVPRFINKMELSEYLNVDDLIICKISMIRGKSIDLTIHGKGFGKIEDGLIVKINPNKVPRIIGREGSMISLIKSETGCNIIVGQNGLIWINGSQIKDELMAKRAIEYIEEKTFIDGLTEKMKEWFKEEKKND